ncbi:uncharacterized protein N7518_001101 [Penicillium psychrosexuale]|uniref:uncharacterized protein n=1 Tax=Penicillium psychrosexuale TaxID=1002107 RepID=UPI002544E34C|nr:uncharacterized protein N7518_001101 [Penicillium psychrosexuale]KAJ5804798.1 hypothetical protein N7518_001101 [Penicillium psychrosexuale]
MRSKARKDEGAQEPVGGFLGCSGNLPDVGLNPLVLLEVAGRAEGEGDLSPERLGVVLYVFDDPVPIVDVVVGLPAFLGLVEPATRTWSSARGACA